VICHFSSTRIALIEIIHRDGKISYDEMLQIVEAIYKMVCDV